MPPESSAVVPAPSTSALMENYLPAAGSFDEMRGLFDGYPGYLLPCHGIQMAGDRPLVSSAADLIRAADGTWYVVKDFERNLRALTKDPPKELGEALDDLDPLITSLVAFSARTHESMTHEEGWHFLEAGRRLERGSNLAMLLQTTLVPVGADSEETLPPPGKPKLQGADASHAWFSVCVPGTGWVDFDPTNDQLPEEQHITTALGRDCHDVAPVRGVFYGGGEHRLEVEVDVDRVRRRYNSAQEQDYRL